MVLNFPDTATFNIVHVVVETDWLKGHDPVENHCSKRMLLAKVVKAPEESICQGVS